MKTVFVNRFFFPDEVATSLMLSDLTIALAQQGRDVWVICSRMRHANQTIEFSPADVVRGVRVRRVWTTALGRRFGLVGRALDSVTFHLMAFCCLVSLIRSGDCVVAKTDPPLLGVTVAVACRLRGAKWVNWLQDIFPEVVSALGIRLPAWLIGSLQAVRNWGLRGASCNVVLGVRMRERLLSTVSGLTADQVQIVANWSRDHCVPARPVTTCVMDGRPIVTPQQLLPPVTAQTLRDQWNLQDRFVVCYSGNLGRAHEFDTFLQAARLIQTQTQYADIGSRIAWLFIGTGASRKRVDELSRQLALTSVHFQPFQPVDCLAASLAVADVHLVSLLPSAEGLIVPSKYYGVASAARPCAFVGDVRGELARILGHADAGAAFAVGDAQGLAQWLVALARQPGEAQRLGHNARRWLEVHGSFAFALERWNLCLYRPAAVSQAYQDVVV